MPRSCLNDLVTSIDKGVYWRPSSVTFEQFAEDWLAGRRKIRGSTESGYESIINRQLIPRIGSVAVSALRFQNIDVAVSGMIEDELAPKTIHNSVTLLRTMLAGRKGPSAIRQGLTLCDPTLGVELPPLEARQVVPPDTRAGLGARPDVKGDWRHWHWLPDNIHRRILRPSSQRSAGTAISRH